MRMWSTNENDHMPGSGLAISLSPVTLTNPCSMPSRKKGANGSTSRRDIRPRFHQSITKITAGTLTTMFLLAVAKK